MITAIGFISGLSVALAIVLVIANSKLKVYEDPRIEVVADYLPGANCGACGLAGCRAFAESVVEGAVKPSQCPVGGAETATYIATYLGIDAGEAERKVARLLCAGGADVAYQVGTYEGYSSCRAAAVVTGGSKACTYGCLGLGDCFDACTFDAIRMSDTGLPIVDVAKCTACGDCVRACPKDLFELYPVSRCLVVQCKSQLEGDQALAQCQVACTACGRCVADAPEGLLTMENNIPVLNMLKMELQTPIATYRCPTQAIVWIEGPQMPELWAKTDFAKPKQEHVH